MFHCMTVLNLTSLYNLKINENIINDEEIKFTFRICSRDHLEEKYRAESNSLSGYVLGII